MWGPAGRAYVYVCYGLHQMLNVVTGDEGCGQAVLVRSCEPLSGIEVVQARRGRRPVAPALLSGPGNVGAALALDRAFSGRALFEPGALEAHTRLEVARPAIVRGARVGIEYARPRDRAARLRFAIAGSSWVTRPSGLTRTRRSVRDEESTGC